MGGCSSLVPVSRSNQKPVEAEPVCGWINSPFALLHCWPGKAPYLLSPRMSRLELREFEYELSFAEAVFEVTPDAAKQEISLILPQSPWLFGVRKAFWVREGFWLSECSRLAA